MESLTLSCAGPEKGTRVLLECPKYMEQPRSCWWEQKQRAAMQLGADGDTWSSAFWPERVGEEQRGQGELGQMATRRDRDGVWASRHAG